MKYVRLPDDRWRHAPLRVSLIAASFQVHSGSKQRLAGVKQMELKQDIHNNSASPLLNSNMHWLSAYVCLRRRMPLITLLLLWLIRISASPNFPRGSSSGGDIHAFWMSDFSRTKTLIRLSLAACKRTDWSKHLKGSRKEIIYIWIRIIHKVRKCCLYNTFLPCQKEQLPFTVQHTFWPWNPWGFSFIFDIFFHHSLKFKAVSKLENWPKNFIGFAVMMQFCIEK